MIKEERDIKALLKDLLKKRGMTYAELATALDLSLPTVRRIMTNEKLSLERLVKICDVLGTSLAEVTQMLKRPTELIMLTEEQEAFFCSHPSYYAYLRCLGRGMTVEDIATQNELTAKETDRFLTELEILKLVKRHAGGARLLISWPANFRFPGPMQEKFFSKIGSRLCEHLTAKTLREPGSYAREFFYYINSVRLVEDSYKKFVQDFYELHVKYRQISDIESERFHWSKLTSATAVFGIDRVDIMGQVIGPVKERPTPSKNT